MHDLHTNPQLLLENPDATKEPSFSTWQSSFSAEQYADEITSLLDRYPELKSTMDSLVVHGKVSHTEFWLRYFYHNSKIVVDEAKRKHLFESNEDENDFDWDGEDEADEAQVKDNQLFPSNNSCDEKMSTETVKPRAISATAEQSEPTPRKSSTSESSTSFDIVSQSSAVPFTREKVALYLDLD